MAKPMYVAIDLAELTFQNISGSITYKPEYLEKKGKAIIEWFLSLETHIREFSDLEVTVNDWISYQQAE